MKSSFMGRQGQPNTMLIVDDDELNTDILTNIFEAKHPIATAENGRLGLQRLEEKREELCAILLDVVMPVMDGIAMLEKLDEMNIPSQIPVFLITGETDSDKIKHAYDLGVMDVISKPIDPRIVERRVNSIMELFAARNHFKEVVAEQTRELKEQAQKLAEQAEELAKQADELARRNENLHELNIAMIETLATVTEFRSGEAGEHVRRIHDITELFLRHEDLSRLFPEEHLELIPLAAVLHDVGKISVCDAILNKPGKLTEDEFKAMQRHTVDGEKMLMRIPHFENEPLFEYASDIARHHHERYDGRGYPDGLKGDEISMSAQIVALADVYDALVSKRVYKPAFGHDEAVRMIEEGKCGIFNNDLLRCFKDIEGQIRTLYK